MASSNKVLVERISRTRGDKSRVSKKMLNHKSRMAKLNRVLPSVEIRKKKIIRRIIYKRSSKAKRFSHNYRSNSNNSSSNKSYNSKSSSSRHSKLYPSQDRLARRRGQVGTGIKIKLNWSERTLCSRTRRYNNRKSRSKGRPSGSRRPRNSTPRPRRIARAMNRALKTPTRSTSPAAYPTNTSKSLTSPVANPPSHFTPRTPNLRWPRRISLGRSPRTYSSTRWSRKSPRPPSNRKTNSTSPRCGRAPSRRARRCDPSTSSRKSRARTSSTNRWRGMASTRSARARAAKLRVSGVNRETTVGGLWTENQINSRIMGRGSRGPTSKTWCASLTSEGVSHSRSRVKPRTRKRRIWRIWWTTSCNSRRQIRILKIGTCYTFNFSLKN